MFYNENLKKSHSQGPLSVLCRRIQLGYVRTKVYITAECLLQGQLTQDFIPPINSHTAWPHVSGCQWDLEKRGKSNTKKVWNMACIVKKPEVTFLFSFLLMKLWNLYFKMLVLSSSGHCLQMGTVRNTANDLWNLNRARIELMKQYFSSIVDMKSAIMEKWEIRRHKLKGEHRSHVIHIFVQTGILVKN